METGTNQVEGASPPPKPEHDAGRIDELLTQLQAMAGPSTWQGIEELVERLVRLYGLGLEKTMGHARDAGANVPLFHERLGGDEVVSSLLLLHGLHPTPVLVRIERALEKVRPLLGTHAGGVEFIGLDTMGVVHLRLLGSCQGCPSSLATVEQTVRRAIEEAAPEVMDVRVEDQQAAVKRPDVVSLAQLPSGAS